MLSIYTIDLILKTLVYWAALKGAAFLSWQEIKFEDSQKELECIAEENNSMMIVSWEIPIPLFQYLVSIY